MRATISRRLTVTTINGFAVKVLEDGTPSVEQVEPVIVFGNVSESGALRELRKAYPEMKGITVSKISSEEKQYEISVSDFVKYARPVEEKKN